MTLPSLRLQKDLSRHVREGHPWIYRDALAPPPRDLPTGTACDLLGTDGKFLARGLWDAASPIALRVYTLDAREALDGALVRRRLDEALASRRGVVDARDTDAFRWCNGEGDFLPGVIVDVYASVAVVKLDGEAARALLPHLVPALAELGRPRGVRSLYRRWRAGSAGMGDDKGELLDGDSPPEIVEVREHGVRLAVDVLRGQKTGTFLDQRENRRAIRPFADGALVANLFSYTGGFSLHAALAGAKRVVSVDSAPAALDGARDNFARNGLDPSRHGFACDDAFLWLDKARARGERYDLAIVDPPSFAPSEKALGAALAAYRKLFAASLGVVAPGGVLCASSCSSHVSHEAFLEVLRDVAGRTQRRLRVLEVRGQPADHPTLPAFPEGRYLKFVICRAS